MASTELSSDVNRVLVAWLINHIIKEDKKIAKHIKSLELGAQG